MASRSACSPSWAGPPWAERSASIAMSGSGLRPASGSLALPAMAAPGSGSNRALFHVKRSTGGEDDHAALRLFADALSRRTGHLTNGVVDDLALERCHRTQLLLLPGLHHSAGRAARQVGQLLLPPRLEAADVDEHVEAGPLDLDVPTGRVYPGGDVTVEVEHVQ